MINFVGGDHPTQKVIENVILHLGAVNPVTELIKIPIDIKIANPGVGCPNPRFNLMDHGMQSFKIQTTIAF